MRVKFCYLAVPLALVAATGIAQANSDVEKNIANPANWAMQAGDMYNQRYSKLNQINDRATSARCKWHGPSPPAFCAVTKARRWLSAT